MTPIIMNDSAAAVAEYNSRNSDAIAMGILPEATQDPRAAEKEKKEVAAKEARVRRRENRVSLAKSILTAMTTDRCKFGMMENEKKFIEFPNDPTYNDDLTVKIAEGYGGSFTIESYAPTDRFGRSTGLGYVRAVVGGYGDKKLFKITDKNITDVAAKIEKEIIERNAASVAARVREERAANDRKAVEQFRADHVGLMRTVGIDPYSIAKGSDGKFYGTLRVKITPEVIELLSKMKDLES